MTETRDNRIYKQEQNKEGQEQLKQYKGKDKENISGEKLSKKIANIDNKLSKLSGNQDGRDFFIRNMNDYVQSKFGVKFEKTQVGGKEELILVIPESKQATPDPIKGLEDLAKNLVINDKEVFIDENNDNKLGKDEIGMKIKKNGELEANAIYVDKDEKGKNKAQVGFGKIKGKEGVIDQKESKGGKILHGNGKDYYEVGEHKDYLSAPIRLFTALSNEYFDGMSAKDLSKKISELGVKKGPKGYEFAKITDSNKNEYKKVGNFNSDIWNQIVQPGSKIDLSSLSKALTSGKVEKQSKIETKEVKDNIDWGRFYESMDGETWDIPDNWNIDYNGYSKDYSGLNGSQISICAKNDYDFGNKDKGILGENTFSAKIEVSLGKDKNGKENKGYLVIGETNNEALKKVKGQQKITKGEFEGLKTNLKDSKTEAWFTVVDKKGNATMTEVGDKKVHTITETSDTVERGENKDHPIVLNKNKYEFSGEIDGNITFKKEKKGNINIDDKNSNLKNIKSQKDFQQAFGGEKAYLLVKNHLVELSFDKTNKKLISKDLGEQKDTNTKFDNGGVSIENSLFSDMKFDKKTGKVEFPEVSGWGQINGKLKKTIKNNKEKGIKKGDILFTLGEEYKIGGKEVIINLGAKTKLKPNKIFENTIKGLLLLATKKDLKNNPEIGKDNTINKKGNSIIVHSDNKITLNKLPGDDILTFQKGEKSDTYIIDAIKNKFEKKSEKHRKKEQTLSKKSNSKEGKREKINENNEEKRRFRTDRKKKFDKNVN